MLRIRKGKDSLLSSIIDGLYREFEDLGNNGNTSSLIENIDARPRIDESRSFSARTDSSS